MDIEALQAKIEGTHDLNDLHDCHAVIQMLLRDLNIANERTFRARTDLKLLAMMVRKGDGSAEKKAEDVISAMPKRPVGEVMEGLQRMADELSRAENLTDVDLTDEVFREVWGNLDFDGRPSAVLEELILRSKRLTGQPVKDEESDGDGGED